MSGLMLNIVCDPGQGGVSRGGKSRGNSKHQRFRGRIRYLESQGLLNEKQNKTQNKKNQDKKVQHKKKRTPQKTQLCEGAVFPKFTSCPPNNTGEPSSSAQGLPKKNTLASVPCTSHTDPAHKVCRSLEPSKYLAMDCEMVGTGPKGCRSELARCSIVSYEGDIVYDKYVKPMNPVTDFRTRWSGIRRQDLVNALPFYQAQKQIVKIMTGKVVVGHAIHNDFKAIRYFHPPCQTRDTSQIPLLNQKAGLPEDQAVSLKKLTKVIFNKDIQAGTKGHSSVEDARATMELYKVVERMWEQKLSSQNLSARAMDLALSQTR